MSSPLRQTSRHPPRLAPRALADEALVALAHAARRGERNPLERDIPGRGARMAACDPFRGLTVSALFAARPALDRRVARLMLEQVGEMVRLLGTRGAATLLGQ